MINVINVKVAGMRITPFQYYHAMVMDLLEQEKNYDTLPNFTAADCLRLLGIGRNQYIDIMNQCRSSKKFLGMIRKPIKDLLPHKPVKDIPIEPWWIVNPGYITEDDVKLMVNANEKEVIDKIVSDDPVPPLMAGDADEKDVRSLYLKGLIYFDIPIENDDLIQIPPLEGFVMNRVTGDYFETLLYTIFVSIDEKTPVAELANVLQIDLSQVKNAISMYCRLGFAYKKNIDSTPNHSSWRRIPCHKPSNNDRRGSGDISLFVNSLDDNENAGVIVGTEGSSSDTNSSVSDVSSPNCLNKAEPTITNTNNCKRIGFLYDSTLAAFLMMGNLSPGLKNHAVTMFEVGKLPDESIDSLLLELSKISDLNLEEDGGEAERYFMHAIMLYRTIQFLRHNPELTSGLVEDPAEANKGLSLDMIRCESLLNLDADTCQRLLNKNYKLLISVAPLSNETRVTANESIPYLGASPLVNSIWFKLYIYSLTGCGPPSLLLSKGVRLNNLPQIFENYETLMITPWGRDSGLIPVSSALIAINEAATYSALLVQAYPECSITHSKDELIYLPLPLIDSNQESGKDSSKDCFENHPLVKVLASHLNLSRNCGYITLVNLHLDAAVDKLGVASSVYNQEFNKWTLFDCHFGIPLFDRALNKQVCNRILSNQLLDSIKSVKLLS